MLIYSLSGPCDEAGLSFKHEQRASKYTQRLTNTNTTRISLSCIQANTRAAPGGAPPRRAHDHTCIVACLNKCTRHLYSATRGKVRISIVSLRCRRRNLGSGIHLLGLFLSGAAAVLRRRIMTNMQPSRQWRRQSYYVIVIIAAVVPPPSPASSCL